MKKYLSLERNCRGFTSARELDSEADFWDAMTHQRDNEHNELDWGVLIDTETGMRITEYRRGMRVDKKINQP